MRFINLFKDENIQTQILDAALKFVPEHGWTKTAIENGIDEMKLPKISAGIISNGPIDLVHHHYEKSNNLLGKIIKPNYCKRVFFSSSNYLPETF